MATTEYTTASAERVQLWAKKIWLEMPREIFWGNFMKENDLNSPIEVKVCQKNAQALTYKLNNKS